MLAIHLLIAFASLFATAFAYVSPTKGKLNASYALVAGTIATGTYLAIKTPGHMLEVCTMGLLFVGVSLVGIAFAKRKMAASLID